MGENVNIDLQKQAQKEFELSDVQELLLKFQNNNTLSYGEKEFKNLDNDDNKLSETEKKLYEQSKESLDIVSFLEGIITELKNKNNNNNKFKNLGTFGAINNPIIINNKEKNNSTNENISNEVTKTFSEITNNFDSYEKLKKDSSARKKILEIDASSLKMCPTSNFKKGKNMSLSVIKEKIAEIETEEIKKKLKGIIPDKQIEKLITGECKSEKLFDLLIEKGLEKKEAIEITSNNILTKNVKNSIKLRKLIEKKDITIENILLIENNDKRIIFLKEKGFNEEEIITIIDLVSEKLNIRKQKKELIKSILNYGLEGYNYLSNNYYLKNTKEIIKISDKTKFLEVVEKLKDNNQNINFYNLSNPSFRGDINIIKEFQKISGKKFEYFSIKDIEFNKLSNNEKIEFLDMLSDDSLKIILIKNEDNINRLKNEKYITKLNNILNNSELSKESVENLDEEEDNQKLDNSLIKLINEKGEEGINIIKKLDIGIDRLLNLPKTINYILTNKNLINYYIKNDYHFYNILPKNLQQIHNTKYIDSVFKNSDDIDIDLAKLQFSNLSNLLTAYNKIEKKNPLLINNLLSRPIFKLTLLEFQKAHSKNKEEIKNLSKKQKNDLNNIFENVNTFGEKNNRYKNIYQESEIEKSVKKDINKKDSIFSVQGKEIGDLISKFSDNGFDEIQGKIVNIIDEYIKNPSGIKTIFNTEIASKLGESKYKEFLTELKVIIDSYFSTPTKTTENEQKGINEKYINKETGEIIINNFRFDYLSKLNKAKQQSKKDKIIFNDKLFTEKYVNDNFPNLSAENKNKLVEQIMYKFIGEYKLNKAINDEKLIRATVLGNQDEIDKQLNNIDNEYEQETENEINSNPSYEINDSGDKPKLINEITGKSFEISNKEKDLAENNPEALENLVKFHDTLMELQIPSIWNYREKIFIALGEKFGTTGFNTSGDYIDKKELSTFLNSILKSVGKDTIEISNTTIEGFKNQFKKKNNMQFNGGMTDDIYKKGKSSVEEIFLEKFINNQIGFQIGKFKETISTPTQTKK